MKSKLMALVLISVLGCFTLNAQGLKGKKLLKHVSSLQETGQSWLAIETINNNFDHNGKSQAEVALKLAELLMQQQLLDSANYALSISEMLNNSKLAEEVVIQRELLDAEKEKFQIEILLAFNAIEKGELADANAAILDAQKYDRGNYQIWLALGEISQEQRDHDEAIKNFQIALSKIMVVGSEKAHVYEHLAESYLDLRISLKAIAAVDSGLALDNENMELLFLKGKAVYFQRDFVNAIDLFEQYNLAKPSNGKVYFFLAESYFELRKYELAIEQYRLSLTLDSTVSNAYMGRGRSYYALGKYEQAEADFIQLLSFYKENYYALNAVGLSQYGQGEFDSALTYFEKAVALSGTNHYTYNLAMASFKSGQFENALQHFASLQAANKYSIKYNVGYTQSLIALKKYQEAKLWIDESLKGNPMVREYLVLALEINDKLGNISDAKEFQNKSEVVANDTPRNLDLNF